MADHINDLSLSKQDRLPTPMRDKIEEQDRSGGEYFLRDGWYWGGRALADKLIAESDADPGMMAPMSFAYRHYLELAMKDIVPGLAEMSGEAVELKKTHDLSFLWREFRKRLKQLPDSPDSGPTDDIMERCIEQLDGFDPDSTAFRYTRDKDGQRFCMFEMPLADIVQLRDTMERIHSYLKGCQDRVRAAQEKAGGYRMLLLKPVIFPRRVGADDAGVE